jgi:flagellar motor switch protein FliM
METAESTAIAPATTASPKPYELSQPTLFTAPELRRLTADYETIRRSCAVRLSLLFRTEFELKLVALETPTFRQFAGRMEQPTHLTLFKVEPLRGIGVLEMTPALALALLDRLMGGPGTADNVTRELTEIEIALLGQVTHLLTEAWCAHWAGWKPLKSTLIGHENDPRYLQTAAPESAMLVANFIAQVGDSTGNIRIALPFATLEPLLQKIRAELKPVVEPAPAGPAPAAKPMAWNPALDHVNMPVSAQLPGPQITARELQSLKVGDVLSLAPEAAQQVQLKFSGVPRFQGRVGTRDEHWAVQIITALNS